MEKATELVPLPAAERQFGRYYLLYRIGTGGMANLYLSRFTGPDGFEKLVAIKRIHEHLSAQPTFLKMFKDEARLAARISHPNVVQVIELGHYAGSYYIAMEYVDGESLTALLNRTKLLLPIAARILADALAGLHAAHELRNVNRELVELVHRDLSPSNILIGYDGAVKVVDFGVARARGTLHVTDVGMVKGKFAYMSPEQVNNRPLDRRSDIFSMGILLYEATTYSRLFRAESEAASVAMIQSGHVVPPSARAPGYPPLLQKIVLRALEREPDKRFATAREMQLALEEYIYTSGSPVTASSVGDLMRSTFSDRIAIKEQLVKASVDNPEEVLPELEQSYSTLKLPVGNLQPQVGAERNNKAAVAASPAAPASNPAAAAQASSDADIEELDSAVLEEEASKPDASETRSPADASAIVSTEPFSGVDLHALRSPLRKWFWLGGIGLLLLGGGLAAVFAARRSKPTDANPTVPVRDIEVTVRARPSEAKIHVDGKPADNPCQLRRAAGSAGAKLEISAAGFRAKELLVSFDRSKTLEVQLEPLLPDAGRGSAVTAPVKPDARVKKVEPAVKKREPAVRKAEPTIKIKRPHPKTKAGSKKGLFGNPYED